MLKFVFDQDKEVSLLFKRVIVRMLLLISHVRLSA